MFPTDTKPNDTILKLPVVTQKTGVKRASIYNKLNSKSKYYAPLFPKPVKLSMRSVGWYESEVQAWIESRRPCDTQKLSA